VVLVTGHFGAVEFLPPALAFSGRALTAMVHCNSPSLRRILERRAARAGVDLLDPKSNSIIFSALDHLKKGRILITQCDEIDMWRPYRDRSINFLGLEVGLDRSMDILIRKSKAPVVFGLMHRRGRGRYELVLTTPRPRAGGSRPESMGAACLRMLGDEIYNCPSAWYEWKKLRPFLPPIPRTEPHADRRSMRLFGQVGLRAPREA
jgi:lauroyl/myristoyl acyltransferase